MVELRYTPEMSNNWSRAWYSVALDKPYMIRRLLDSMTTSQMESKLWLASELQKVNTELKNVVVIGGWYCHILSALLFDELGVEFMINYDIDRDSQLTSYKFNQRYKDANKFTSSRRNLFTTKVEKIQTD